jgi:hypothetical protein
MVPYSEVLRLMVALLTAPSATAVPSCVSSAIVATFCRAPMLAVVLASADSGADRASRAIASLVL